MMFAIEKLKFLSFSLFLDASPLDPRCPLDNEMSLFTYTSYVKGEQGCTSERRHKTSDKHKPICKMVIFIMHQLDKYIKSIVIGQFLMPVTKNSKHSWWSKLILIQN